MAPLPGLKGSDIACVVLQRRPELGQGCQNILECARHDTNNAIETVVKRDLAPHNRPVASKASPPQCVAEDYDSRPVEVVIRKIEVPSHGGRNPQRTKVHPAHPLPFQSFPLPSCGYDLPPPPSPPPAPPPI